MHVPATRIPRTQSERILVLCLMHKHTSGQHCDSHMMPQSQSQDPKSELLINTSLLCLPQETDILTTEKHQGVWSARHQNLTTELSSSPRQHRPTLVTEAAGTHVFSTQLISMARVYSDGFPPCGCGPVDSADSTDELHTQSHLCASGQTAYLWNTGARVASLSRGNLEGLVVILAFLYAMLPCMTTGRTKLLVASG